MTHKRLQFSIAFSVGLIFMLASGAFADTIRLKDGSIIKGRITSFGGGKFEIVLGEGTRRKSMSLVAAEIESIQFDDDNRAAVPRAVVTDNSQAYYKPAPQPVRQAPPVAAVKTPIKSPVDTAQRKAVPAVVANAPRTPPSAALVKPVEVNVKVLADNTANGWTNSGFVVKRGQRIRITGDGQISLGGGKTSDPSGLYDLNDDGKLMKSVPTGALIAVIGDNNNEFIYVGSTREFIASRDGSLFLGVNEGNLNDNSGSYAVKVEISPGEGS